MSCVFAIALGALLVLGWLPMASAQNLVINGDFELNTVAGCDFNLSSAEFSAVISNAFSFGAAQEIDVMNDAAGCGFGGPPPGQTTKLGLASRVDGTVDGLALELSAPVVGGRTYEVTLLVEAVTDFTPVGPLSVGLSGDPNSFGTPVLTDTALADAWTEFSGTFTAPVDATYLTLQGESGMPAWHHIDRVTLHEFALEMDHFQCYRAKDLKSPKFVKQLGVPVMDQLGLAQVDVKKPSMVCTPADVDGTGINDPDSHLCCYLSKGPKLVPSVDVETTDMFGTLELGLKKSKMICAPCSKTLLEP